MSGHWEFVKEWVEDDEEDGFDPDDDDDDREFERLSECICGAYIWSQKAGRILHVADCCCGRT